MKGRATRRAGLWIGLSVFVSLAAAACAPETRYHVLSFVFDGVPPPPGVTASAEPPGERGQRAVAGFNGGTSAAALGALPSKAPTFLSIHKPVAENKCQECHDRSIGFDEMPLHDARLCDKCHLEQREREGWAHGPINLGSCVPCHEPHKSRFARLLTKPIPQLCLECHQEDMDRSEDYHNVPNVDECVACHDPHRMY